MKLSSPNISFDADEALRWWLPVWGISDRIPAFGVKIGFLGQGKINWSNTDFFFFFTMMLHSGHMGK